MEVSGQLHVPRRKSPQHPVERRLGGPHSRSGRGGEKTFAAARNGTPVN